MQTRNWNLTSTQLKLRIDQTFLMTFAKVTNAAVMLLASSNVIANCDSLAHRLPGPLVGIWTEYQVSETSNELLGTLTTRYEANGCALVQDFQSPDGSFGFTSLGFVASDGDGQETYVLSNGRVASYRWQKENEEIILNRIVGEHESLRRLRIFDISENGYFVADESSTDGDGTWEQSELVHTI